MNESTVDTELTLEEIYPDNSIILGNTNTIRVQRVKDLPEYYSDPPP